MLLRLWGKVKIGIVILRIYVEDFLKFKSIIIILFCYVIFWDMFKGLDIRIYRYLLCYVYCCFFDNS